MSQKTNEDGTVEFSFPDEVDKEPKKQVETDLQIEVEDDTPEQDRNRKPMTDAPVDPTDEELQQYSADAQKRIKHFTKGYHDERRAKETAMREREEAVRALQTIHTENQKLRGSIDEGHTALIATTKSAIEAEVLSAKSALRKAQDEFDSEAIVDAQEKLTEAKIKLSRLDDFRRPTKTAGQDEKDDVKTPASAPAQKAVPPDQKALAWNQRNQWFGKDPEMTSYVLGLHRKLVDEGIDTRSDSYYERIDARVRKLFPESFDSDAADEKPQKKQSTPVAPATRSTAPKKIVLTQSQVQIARRLGVSLEDYAKQVVLDQRKQND